MTRDYHKWYSPALNREMEMLVFGHYGRPLLVFPSAQGRFFDYECNHMIETIRPSIEAGRIKVFCVDGIDSESWFNRGLHPADRVRAHQFYEQYVTHEVFPFIHHHCRSQGIRIAATGSSFGAFHTLNFALKHPWNFSHILCLSGNYDLRDRLDGHYDDNLYFNNPPDYLPKLDDHGTLEAIRKIKIALIVGQGAWEGNCIEQTQRISAILHEKGIPHQLDLWGHDTPHDWPSWRRMAAHYIPQIS